MIESGQMDFEARIVAPECIETDNETDFSLRPKTFADYIGQDKVKENLKIYIQAAKRRGEHLDHTLLYGPPGLGKTTLANIIASELGVNIHTTSGPAIERPGDLAAILTTLEKNDVLFIDEIHRLSKQVEEILYPAMEDLAIDIILEKGLGARSVRLDIQPFTLVGATTRAGQLSPPLRDRFGVLLHMEPYTHEQLAQIISRNAITLGIGCDSEGAFELARRARGTPRIANRLLKRVRDFAEIIGDGIITSEIADLALTKLEIDKLGLDSLDRKLLKMMINAYNGGPVGLDTLAAAIGEEAVTIEDVCEPYLMQLGFLKRTPKGRCVTAQAYAHLGLKSPDSINGQLSFDA